MFQSVQFNLHLKSDLLIANLFTENRPIEQFKTLIDFTETFFTFSYLSLNKLLWEHIKADIITCLKIAENST